jgi:hypothetical protein
MQSCHIFCFVQDFMTKKIRIAFTSKGLDTICLFLIHYFVKRYLVCKYRYIQDKKNCELYKWVDKGTFAGLL